MCRALEGNRSPAIHSFRGKYLTLQQGANRHQDRSQSSSVTGLLQLCITSKQPCPALAGFPEFKVLPHEEHIGLICSGDGSMAWMPVAKRKSHTLREKHIWETSALGHTSCLVVQQHLWLVRFLVNSRCTSLSRGAAASLAQNKQSDVCPSSAS